MDGASHPSSPCRSGANNDRDRSPGGSGLLKAFKRLGFGSSSPKGKNGLQPSPHVSPQQNSSLALQSLPPYLAHLAGPSRRPDAHPIVEFPKAQHYGSPGRDNRLHPSSPKSPHQRRLQSPSRSYSLPRPPVLAGEHPNSLQPAQIRLSSSASQPYPWELVPQQRPPSGQVSRPDQPTTPPLAPSIHANQVTPISNISDVNLATPPRKSRKDQLSSPASPLTPRTAAGFSKAVDDSPAAGQCWGIKQDGSRCTRRVRTGSSPTKTSAGSSRASRRRQGSEPPMRRTGQTATDAFVLHSDGSSVDDSVTRSRRAPSVARAVSEEVEEVYCFQHIAEVNKTAGFYPPGNKTIGASLVSFIHFEDWFGTVELSKHTQALLRRCMSQPPTDADRVERGYIYIYELRDRSDATHLCLKIGRTVNVFRRLGQWRSQCQSKDPLLRAFFPASNDKQQGLLSGADSVDAPAVPYSHKWERLVHLELNDLGHRVADHCQDCGSKHREIFMIPRITLAAQEGFQLTVQIVQKWLDFTQRLNCDSVPV